MSVDAFEERLRAATKVRKIMGLAAGNENPHEAEAAMRAARVLADKHGLDITTLQPIAPGNDEAAKRAQGRRMNDIYTAAIAKTAVGGADTTDYTQKPQRRRDEDPREDWEY